MSMGKKYLDRKIDLDINDGAKHTHVLHFYVSRPIYTIQGSVLSQVLGSKQNYYFKKQEEFLIYDWMPFIADCGGMGGMLLVTELRA